MPELQDRYARHHLIDWWDQDRLRSARVMVAGAGAIGNEVLKLLALTGVGHVLVVDYDRIELSNLTRSVLFREADIGQPKALVAAERARELNPDIEVIGIAGDLEFDIGLGLYGAMDVVIGCLDSINARLAVNRACRRAGVPWLNGGIEATIAEITLFSGIEGPCFACTLTPEMWDRRNRRYSCTRMVADAPEKQMPTTATVASIAAGYLVNEALLLLHSDQNAVNPQISQRARISEQSAEGTAVSIPDAQHRTPEHPQLKEGLKYGQKLYLMFKPYSFHQLDLPMDADCYAHERYSPVETLHCNPANLSVLELLRRMELLDGVVELGYDLITEMRCVRCGRNETILRPLERCPESLGRCLHCGELTRQPETISRVDAESPLANRTLADLGVPNHQILAIKGSDDTRYVLLGTEAIWNEGK